MNNITIEKTIDSPHIILNHEQGLIEIHGKSYTENTFSFYEPVIKWFKEYFNGNCQLKTTVSIKLIYFNSTTSQLLYTLLDIISESSCDLSTIDINWYYYADNEDSYEDYEDTVEEYPTLHIKPVAFNESEL